MKDLDRYCIMSVAAKQIGAHPAAVFRAAERLRLDMPKVGRTRLIERARLPEVAAEIARRLLESRKPVG